MKGKVFASLLLVCLPWLAMAQSNDDLYFIPKKEKKVERKEKVSQAPAKVSNTAVYAAPGSTVVVKDAAGRTRDVDEYNRRYTSRDYTFSADDNTLYVEEKPSHERGEWINGFEGSQDDYEYAMRIVRFRSPRYAIPVSSPLYWDVVYGAYPSWQWNVYDDGLYAYVFPTYTNPMWWDWRWSWGFSGPHWGFNWGWHSPCYYNSWYSPYWHGGYWGHAWHHHHYYHYGHYYPHYGWGGGHYSYGHTDYRSSRYRGSGTSRRNYVSSGVQGNSSRPRYGNSSVRRNSSSSIGRVVRSNENNRINSVRPSGISGNRGTVGTRTPVRGSSSGYVRPGTTIDRSGNTYNRPSSTRRSNTYNSNTSRSRNSYNTQRSTGRSSFSSGSGSSYNRGSMGGGSTRRSSGGGSSRRR